VESAFDADERSKVPIKLGKGIKWQRAFTRYAARTVVPIRREEDDISARENEAVHQPCRSLPHPLNWEEDVFIVNENAVDAARNWRRCAPTVSVLRKVAPRSSRYNPSAGAAA